MPTKTFHYIIQERTRTIISPDNYECSTFRKNRMCLRLVFHFALHSCDVQQVYQYCIGCRAFRCMHWIGILNGIEQFESARFLLAIDPICPYMPCKQQVRFKPSIHSTMFGSWKRSLLVAYSEKRMKTTTTWQQQLSLNQEHTPTILFCMAMFHQNTLRFLVMKIPYLESNTFFGSTISRDHFIFMSFKFIAPYKFNEKKCIIVCIFMECV